MGNSTIKFQAIIDKVQMIGDLNPVFNNTGGWADEPAVTIGNDVMSELISVRYPWKWNRLKIPPFPLTSWQQDYVSRIQTIGWLENGLRIDVNNPNYPQPSWPIYAVRDLEMNDVQSAFPYQYAWFYNRDLEQRPWPGANTTYINPIGTTTPPSNAATNIMLADGSILFLVQYGTTGDEEPVIPPWTPPPDDPTMEEPDDYPIGIQIADGTCIWEVADPDAQGFRFAPRPPQAGNVWLVRLFAQNIAPTITKMTQKIDPIPDDQIKWFRDGCIAYAHRYSTNPNVKAQYPFKKAEWLAAVEAQARQNDREDENKGFFPDRGVMSPSYVSDPGPYPYRGGWRS